MDLEQAAKKVRRSSEREATDRRPADRRPADRRPADRRPADRRPDRQTSLGAARDKSDAEAAEALPEIVKHEHGKAKPPRQ
jgi:hypothetical protein